MVVWIVVEQCRMIGVKHALAEPAVEEVLDHHVAGAVDVVDALRSVAEAARHDNLLVLLGYVQQHVHDVVARLRQLIEFNVSAQDRQTDRQGLNSISSRS